MGRYYAALGRARPAARVPSIAALLGLLMLVLGCSVEEPRPTPPVAPSPPPVGSEPTAPAPRASTQTSPCQFTRRWTDVNRVVARRPDGKHLSPLQIAADPSVMFDGGRYRMWFTTGDSQKRTGIAHAESTDGVRWSVWRRPDGPQDPIVDLVLTSRTSDWDSPGIENAFVLRAPSGEYRMYYTGHRPPEGSNAYAIGLATSTDGLRWQRWGTGPVFDAVNSWERPTCKNPADPLSCRDGGPLEPSVIYDAKEQRYKMWYAAVGTKGFLSFRIGYATSPDGFAWTRRPNPVLDTGPKGGWDEVWVSQVNVVADPVRGYHLFYFGTAVAEYCDNCEMQRGSIGHAYSTDGVTWTRNTSNPLLSPRAGQWDRWAVGGPSASFDGNALRLWYFGNEGSGLKTQIASVTVPCS
jgi:hypothetical protein